MNLAPFHQRRLVLFSHPAAFAPVSTSELIAFARAAPEFYRRGVALPALSPDSLFANLGWVRGIEQATGMHIPFPIMADPDRAIARRYGMLMSAESAVEPARCVFALRRTRPLARALFTVAVSPRTRPRTCAAVGRPSRSYVKGAAVEPPPWRESNVGATGRHQP
jgi:alkyl hydroperoxide reductase subunit AhpC